MWEAIGAIAAVSALMASAAGAIYAAYLGNRNRVKAELEARYDSELRGLRLKAYPKLWALMEPLAKYAREPQGYPDRVALDAVSRGFRSWYFTTGGVYLSPEARDAYFQFQGAVWTVVTSRHWDAKDDHLQVDAETFANLFTVSSWLRTALTYDVGTRRRFSLAPEWAAEDAKVNEHASMEDHEVKRRAQHAAEELQAFLGPRSLGRHGCPHVADRGH